MALIFLKLVEVAGRALFVVGVTFALPLADAGRFGIAVTIISFFAFLAGWERYIDLQRRLVGEPEHVFDRGVTQALRLFAVNWALLMPVLFALLAFAVGLGWELALGGIAIAVAEQLGNQLYAITLVQPRYRDALIPIALRSAIMALFVGGVLLIEPAALSLQNVFFSWAAVSVATGLVTAVIWAKGRTPVPSGAGGAAATADGIFEQHRASLHHALIGLLSVLTLQLDRLAIGALLPDSEAGVYFRHALLVSFAYQFFNIVSYNRIVGQVFGAAKSQSVAVILRRVRLETAAALGVGVAGGGMVALLFFVSGKPLVERFHLTLELALILLVGALVRIAADLHALILNATRNERVILRHQAAAVVVGLAAIISLGRLFGVTGAATATVLAATAYLLLNLFAIKRIGRQGAALTQPAHPQQTPTTIEPV